MSIVQLFNLIFDVKKNDADVINQAKANLNDIGSLFRETISNYRKHADATRTQAEEYEMKAAQLQAKAQKALENRAELDAVAREAEDMAKRIEDSMGGAKFMEVSA